MQISIRGFLYWCGQIRPLEENPVDLSSFALKLFIWLAINNRCWTVDRLDKRGLPHPAACPLCDQVEESIQHILVSCVFSRQVWSHILQRLGVIAIATHHWPVLKLVRSSSHSSFQRTLERAYLLIVLVAWEIWKHRNDCVFNGARPNVSVLLLSANSC